MMTINIMTLQKPKIKSKIMNNLGLVRLVEDRQ